MRDDVTPIIISYKEKLQNFRNEILQSFTAQTNITHLTEKWVDFIEQVIVDLFKLNHLGNEGYCLIALGSFGRRELQLYSDIDLVILYSAPVKKTHPHAITFVQNCWDIGLELSQQIVSIEEYLELANRELTVISSAQDMRFLCGQHALFESVYYQTQALHMWPCDAFYLAKKQEQQERWNKYSDTHYNLEPNVKYGVGSLRDLQLISTILKRHFGFKKLINLVKNGVITTHEYEQYLSTLHFLWRVRFGLHVLARKREDRILFNYQKQLALLFGYQDNKDALAVEQFMQSYFRVSKQARQLTEILLQWFTENILTKHDNTIKIINARFQLCNHLIEHQNELIFQDSDAMMELFAVIANHPQIKGIRANTIRKIHQQIHLLANAEYATEKTKAFFLSIFNGPFNPYLTLDFMNRFGVLAHYLNCFAKVSGKMQYDLYHVYTVDQHTLFVIRHIAHFLEPDGLLEFPLAAKIMQTLTKRATLYLAALFHDIAKGRGGDHSILGAEEAKQFANIHQLEASEAHLLEWLVRHHLLMSSTIHREDIHDPLVIKKFCEQVQDQRHLDYLYLLTVADICATNPKLWNTWKDSLLKTLYHHATRYFQTEQGLLKEKSIINEKRCKAKVLLRKKGWSDGVLDELWRHFKRNYFLHESTQSIAFHTQLILTAQTKLISRIPVPPLIHIRPQLKKGGTELFIYMPQCDERFMICTTVLCNHHVTIQEAYISTCNNHYNLDTYLILLENTQSLLNETLAEQIQKELEHALLEKKPPKLSQRRPSADLVHFTCPTKVTFSDIADSNMTEIFLISTDRPGLLAKISRIFYHEKIQLISAKVTTFGARAEDTFHVTNACNTFLSHHEKEQLSLALIAQVDKN